MRTILIVAFTIILTSLQVAIAKQEAENNEKIKLKVISIVTQEEINTQIKSQNSATGAGAAFGLLGALVAVSIDAEVNKKRLEATNKQSDQYKNMLIDYHVRPIVHKIHKSILENLDTYELVDYIESTKYDKKQLRARNHISEKNESLLILNTLYSFDPDINLIHITTSAKKISSKDETTKKYKKKHFIAIYQGHKRTIRTAWMTDEEKKKKIAAIEANRKTAKELKKIKIKEVKRQAYIQLDTPIEKAPWSPDLLKQELETGIVKTAQAIAQALDSPMDKKALKALKSKKTKLSNHLGFSRKGKILDKRFTAYPLDSNDEFENFYIKSLDRFNKNVYYIFPSGEAIQFPK